MSLTPSDVSRIAHLARLDLSTAESSQMLAQLGSFFRIVEQMDAVDTHGVEPLFTPLSAVQEVALRLRDDAVTEPVSESQRGLNQASAPAVEAGLYLVPRVIE
ncbi:MAG: Asp-tRNA(Asn)/Glu-tRNA(Gln) amidotransferase subunit GatC [Ideonella sp. WA131b]|jgi:aspartyl-tRNA(Asn)/glutamyl-tRNA(Gln) amidotransferase subunit C|nr:Asp-tRNA(Asn)/Glu-tRNA(Gln) amidotransferase subunit GatC [Ideonella sp. WA131b]